MKALQFWKTVAADGANVIEDLFSLLDGKGIRYCLIGGQGVNAYVEPVVSLDIDLVVAEGQMAELRSLLAETYRVKEFAHSLNVERAGSNVRVQIQTDPRYAAFVARAERRSVLGLALPVARVEDVLQGKVWAVEDASRRRSKRQKDLADIARLLDAYPALADRVPGPILRKLES